MKKLLYIFAFVVAIVAMACSKSDDSLQEGKGAVTFSFPTRAGEESGETDEVDEIYKMMKFRIYSHTTVSTANDEADGEGSGTTEDEGSTTEQKSLVRLYTYEEITAKDFKMWLLAGKYSIAVEGGLRTPASFTDIYYQGNTEFTLSAGEQKSVKVVARPKNTFVKVIFDSTIAAKLTEAQVVVAIDNAFRADKIASGEVPSLTYEQTQVGSFLLEPEQTSFVWNFTGNVTEKGTSVDKSGVYTPNGGFKEGAMYTITFKYSDDLGGYITMDVKVDDTIVEVNDLLVFKPEPQITGPALDAELPIYAGMNPLAYDIKAIADLKTVKVKVGASTYTYTYGGDNSAIAEYFTVEQVTEGSNLNWRVTLRDKLLAVVAAGSQQVRITAVDVEDVEGEVLARYFGEGAFGMETINTWNATAKLKAYVNNPSASEVVICYRESGASEWQQAPATLASDNVYITDVVPGIDGGRTYEYYLYYGGAQKGANATFKTVGVQIPNSGMEEWRGDSPLLPYLSDQSQWWDTGNHGSSTLDKNVTEKSTNTRPGSTGSYSAYLKSQFVSLFGIGKFAAGNIFFGKYLETNGTNGVIGFGKPFTFDYKPKKLVVWYKGRVGTCDYEGGGVSKGQSDKAQIYVWLCNWTNYHAVDTSNQSTFVNPETTTTVAEGNVIAYGVWSRVKSDSDSGADNGWHKLEIPITYREGEGFSGVKPNYLVISCAASAYGDYFAGSTDSYMYVDDFEFVY